MKREHFAPFSYGLLIYKVILLLLLTEVYTMRKASEVMYRIANFFIWVLIIWWVVAIVFSILSMTNVLPNESLGVSTLVPACIMLLIELIILAFSRHAANSARDGNKRAFPHIWMLIMGIFGWNIFFILGAIFGLVSLR